MENLPVMPKAISIYKEHLDLDLMEPLSHYFKSEIWILTPPLL